eukprot:COSAG04_NODE_1048_length_8561_cov_3.101749_6_plen_187_part_00
MKQRLASQADVEKGGGFSVPVEGEGTANPLEGSETGAGDDRGSSGGFTFGAESSLAKTLSSSHTEQEQRNLGEQVSKIILVTPTILNWLAIMVARFISTAEIVDSENVTHDVPRSRNFNFNFVFTPSPRATSPPSPPTCGSRSAPSPASTSSTSGAPLTAWATLRGSPPRTPRLGVCRWPSFGTSG